MIAMDFKYTIDKVHVQNVESETITVYKESAERW